MDGHSTLRRFHRSLSERTWTTLLFLLVAGGCSEAVTDPFAVDPDDPAENDRTAVATPAGGELQLLGGAVILDLPAGAVASEVSITVEPASGTVPANGLPGGIYTFGPSGLTFDEPVLLTVGYPADDVPDGVDPAWLRLYDFTSGTPELLLGSLHDEAGAKVSAEIQHFSVLGAGEATSAEVVEAIKKLFSRLDEGKVMLLDRYREGLERDLALTEPVLEAECLATNVLAEKIVILNQLLGFEELKDKYGIGETAAALCGGLLDGDDALVDISPERPWMPPESTQQFTGTMYGPGGQVLEGPIRWASEDPTVLSVDSLTGVVNAIEPGHTSLIAFSTELPDPFLNSMSIVVFDELDVVIEPSPVEVAFDGHRDVDALVLNKDTGEEQEGASPIFRILDTGVADFDGFAPFDVTRVRGRSVGTTKLEVCARIFDTTVDTDFCATADIEVIPTVDGSWSFQETLTVDVDPPATEVCTTDGTAQIRQIGRTYFGTTEATVTCTYDPMDGSEPEVFEEVVTGDLGNGVITGEGFYHEISYSDEACRSSGTLVRGGEFSADIFHAASGTTECLDDLDFYSVGPLTALRPGYETSQARHEE